MIGLHPLFDGSIGSKTFEPGVRPAYFPRVAFDSPTSADDAIVKAGITAYFCRVAETFGLPRSVALIYAALFIAEKPLCFTDIATLPGLGKASASTGLRLLQRMRAVRIVDLPADRATWYEPELSLRRLLEGYYEETLKPGLGGGREVLDSLDGKPSSAHLQQRIASLQRWHQLTGDLLQVIHALQLG